MLKHELKKWIFYQFVSIKEAPKRATIFGKYSDGPVLLTIDCQSGVSQQYEAHLVSFTSIFNHILKWKIITYSSFLESIGYAMGCFIESYYLWRFMYNWDY